MWAEVVVLGTSRPAGIAAPLPLRRLTENVASMEARASTKSEVFLQPHTAAQTFAEFRRVWGNAGPPSLSGGTMSLRDPASSLCMEAAEGMTITT